jgi:hypothetical protein
MSQHLATRFIETLGYLGQRFPNKKRHLSGNPYRKNVTKESISLKGMNEDGKQ